LEQPIYFYNKSLRDSKLNYNIMEKHAYALVNALKEFKFYILHCRVISCVPTSAVKDILTQPDVENRRVKWIAIILEYDLEIKTTKLVKCQGLEKLMAQSNFDLLGINFIAYFSLDAEPTPQVSQKFLSSPWYSDIIYILHNLQAPPELSKNKAIFFKLKEEKLCIIDGFLYWKDPGGVLLNFLLEDEEKRNMKKFH
jgi:hypothetical protein